jgi:hypothetical protein
LSKKYYREKLKHQIHTKANMHCSIPKHRKGFEVLVENRAEVNNNPPFLPDQNRKGQEFT